ncbi:transposase [Mycolicibacterium hippocampi]|uniref:transposase n=1 Tax=Mycolicibacterium hippocampi TaxID=659824 RepID=UPI00351858E6
MAAEDDGEDTEVQRARRSWPASYKLRILEEIDEAKRTGEPGAVGAIERREGLYSSLISEWRKQRDAGALEGLKAARTGRPAKDRTKAENAKLRAQNDKLRAEIETLKELVDAQGKAAALLRQMSDESAKPTRDS